LDSVADAVADAMTASFGSYLFYVAVAAADSDSNCDFLKID